MCVCVCVIECEIQLKKVFRYRTAENQLKDIKFDYICGSGKCQLYN